MLSIKDVAQKTAFRKSLRLLKTAQLESPNIVIQPTEQVIQKAVDLLKKMDPNYFVGVKQININPSSGNYGSVESGKDKDPTVVNINLSKIKQHAGSEMSPELIVETALTIAHECAHVKSFNNEGGFVGGEAPAEQEERRVSDWIKNNLDKVASIENKNVIKKKADLASEIGSCIGADCLNNVLKQYGLRVGKFSRDRIKLTDLKGNPNDKYYIEYHGYNDFKLKQYKRKPNKSKPVSTSTYSLSDAINKYDEDRWIAEQTEEELIDELENDFGERYLTKDQASRYDKLMQMFTEEPEESDAF